MDLTTLRLKDFRNIPVLQLELHSKLNFLFGPNGAGKTNLLEAIHLLLEGGSFRTGDFRNLIRQGQSAAGIVAQISQKNGAQEIRASLDEERKRFWKDGKTTNGAGLSHLFAVLFAPEEVIILKGSPAGRRERVDSLLKKLSPNYRAAFRDYQKVLLQRNRFLKDAVLSDTVLSDKDIQTNLSPWNETLVNAGSVLIAERREWIAKWSRRIEIHYDEIAGKSSRANFVYLPNVEEDRFLEELENARELELVRGLSLVGPHRDDIQPRIGDQEVKRFGSQGEARTFTLAMKIAEIDLFREVWQEDPVLLLDDVASELDENRNRSFFQYLSSYGGQVFVTATSEELVPLKKLPEFRHWKLPLTTLF